MNSDRYNMHDTPESADERECAKSAAYEREIERGDMLRDEQRDRQMEEAMERDEAAPPVPQRLADEISAEHLRATPAASPPRFFRETSTGMEWEFRNGKMTTGGEDSLFHDPADILECLDVIEISEAGEPLPITPDTDREYQIRKDNES